MKVGIFQFNGCNKCFQETLLLQNGAIEDVIRVDEPAEWESTALDVAVVAGYLTAEDRPTIKKIADHSKQMVAYGSCPATGGIFGLAYQRGAQVIPLQDMYADAINVHGCLGEIEELAEAIKGQSFTKTRALCKACARKSECDYIEEVNPIIDVEENPEICFNDQGLMCTGFIAIECKENCVKYGTPCRGCKPMVDRPGFRMLGMWGTLMGHIEVATEATGKGGTDKLADRDDEITEGNPDIVGNFFRFGLPNARLPIGRQPSTGSIYGDIFVGRTLAELPLLTGMAGGVQAVATTIDVLQAYEAGAEVAVSATAQELRSKLLEAEEALQNAAAKADSEGYKAAADEIRLLAGNMNLSNLYFGGFKVPVPGYENYSDYKYTVIEVQSGTYQHGTVKFSVDDRGIITEFSMEDTQ